MKRLLLFLFLAALPAAAEEPFLQRAFEATLLLYEQTADGGMSMRCTATIFEKTSSGYLLQTAAHCVADDDTDHERVKIRNTSFFVTADEAGEKRFLPVKVIAAGYQHQGDDFAVLELETTQQFPVVPLGDEALEPPGAAVVNVASPAGLGKQIFRGYISLSKLDRPLVEGSINWQSAMLLQIAGGPGSSGSAILSESQQAIVAFLVGRVFDNPGFVAVPVSRFKRFREAVANGTYKWFPE